MSKQYITDQVFENIDASISGFEKAEYEQCTFIGCLFTGVDLRDISFSDCIFTECDLSNSRIDHTSFRQVKFETCKLLGLHFENCNPFLIEMEFERCTMDLSSFYKMNLKKTVFRHCRMIEVDLTQANLENAIFEECDLTNAVFDKTNLSGADMRTAIGYRIDPTNNTLRKAKFSRDNLQGLLSGFGILIQ